MPHILIANYYMTLGGSQLSAFYLGRELLKRDYRVSCLVGNDGPMVKRYEAAGMPVRLAPEAFSDPCPAVLESISPDLVYASAVSSFKVVETAQELNVPVIWRVPGNAREEYPTPGEDNLDFSRAAKVLFISEETAKAHKHLISNPRFQVISNGVDLEECDAYLATHDRADSRRALAIPRDAFLFSMVGSITPNKNQLMFLRAAVEIIERDPDADVLFAIFGDRDFSGSEYVEEVQAFIDARGRGRILLFPKQEDVLTVYRASDCIVICSLSEGMPRVSIEAAAMRVPIISTPVGGVPDLIEHGRSGVLVPFNDVGALRTAMVQLMESADAGRSYAEQAHATIVARYDIRKIAEMHDRLFKKVLADKTRVLPRTDGAPLPPLKLDWPGQGRLRHLPNRWHERRGRFWDRRLVDMDALVFFGDSIIEQWYNLPGFPNVKSVNRGICGDTTRGLLFRLQEDVLDSSPAAVVILIGINDLDCGSTPADVFENLKALVARIPVPTVVCQISPRFPIPDKFPKEIIELNQMIAGHFERTCDMYTPLSADGRFVQDFFEDAVHPNRNGYKLMAKALRPVVTDIMKA